MSWKHIHDSVKQAYDFEHWPDASPEYVKPLLFTEALAEQVTPLQLDLMAEPNLTRHGIRLKYKLDHVQDAPVNYHYASDDGNIGIDVTVKRFDSVVEAREALIDLLCQVSGPKLLAWHKKITADQNKPMLGDVCFVNDGDIKTTASFVRGNKLVDVRSVGHLWTDILEIAHDVDTQLQQQGLNRVNIADHI